MRSRTRSAPTYNTPDATVTSDGTDYRTDDNGVVNITRHDVSLRDSLCAFRVGSDTAVSYHVAVFREATRPTATGWSSRFVVRFVQSDGTATVADKFLLDSGCTVGVLRTAADAVNFACDLAGYRP